MSDIYTKLIDEILELPGYNLSAIAGELSVGYAALKQIYNGKTKKPHASQASALFHMHIYLRPDLWGLGARWRIRLTLENGIEGDDGDQN